ncbi:MAG: hypothetical protein KGK08_01700 [Acidobacteriota bacterium]|nr:hypothetical protein [Acidobacteriota bacterium]
MKKRTEFQNQDDWLAYVRATVPPEDVPFILSMGLTDTYREFYEMRSRPFPERFSLEIERISTLAEPERTKELDALNDSIMGDAIQFLMTAAGVSTGSGTMSQFTPRGTIEGLQEHLRTKNPYFALWTHYQDNVAGRDGAPDWRAYAIQKMQTSDDREIDFAVLISELGKCLELYHQREMQLPKHFYSEIWFLYRSNEPERNAMTRALVQELVEGLEPCGSA